MAGFPPCLTFWSAKASRLRWKGRMGKLSKRSNIAADIAAEEKPAPISITRLGLVQAILAERIEAS